MASSREWFPVFTILLAQLFQLSEGEFLVSIINDKGGREILPCLPDNGTADWLAKGSFNRKTDSTGWAFLEIESNGELSDPTQAYEAGYVEGFLTYDYIANYSENVWKPFCTNRTKTCARIDKFFDSNYRWVTSMVKKYHKTSSRWHQVNLYYSQLYGILDGFNEASRGNRNMTWHEILMINMLWDMETLAEALVDDEEKVDERANLGSCSAIVKLTTDYQDLLTAHNTWTAYNTMLRVMKKYVINVHLSENSTTLVPGRTVAFSSYPGVIISGDDFNVISSGLVTMETTNAIYNTKLWHLITHRALMTSVRSFISNRLAKSGIEWVKTFSAMNSGTYNNQWMVIDYKKFTRGQKPDQGVLTIVEQLPGEVFYKDVTYSLLSQGYWASYNVPYFPDAYNQSGYFDKYLHFGDWYSHNDCPRAKIFKREQIKVKDLTSLMALMTYNDYRNDPYSACTECKPVQNACNAIAARCDLNPYNGSYPIPNLMHRMHGATDAKMTNSTLVDQFLIYAISGPTHGNGLPSFQWSKLAQEDNWPHSGLPDVWNFKPLLYRWEDLK